MNLIIFLLTLQCVCFVPVLRFINHFFGSVNDLTRFVQAQEKELSDLPERWALSFVAVSLFVFSPIIAFRIYR
jgi:hypothetical protein